MQTGLIGDVLRAVEQYNNKYAKDNSISVVFYDLSVEVYTTSVNKDKVVAASCVFTGTHAETIAFIKGMYHEHKIIQRTTEGISAQKHYYITSRRC